MTHWAKAVLWAAALALAPISGAQAQSTEVSADALTQAIAAVSARLPVTAGQSGAVGRADPAMRANLDQLEQLGLRLGSDPATPLNFANYSSHCTPLARIASTYLRDGMDTLPAAAQSRAVSANLRRFQDEMAMLLDITVHCNTAYLAVLPAVLARPLSAEERGSALATLRQIRTGMRFTLSGIAGMATDPEFSARSRARFMQVMVRSGPAAIQQFPLAERDVFAQMLVPRLTEWAPADRPAAAQLTALLASRDCTGLCQVATPMDGR
jgi:hypothetical protein